MEPFVFRGPDGQAAGFGKEVFAEAALSLCRPGALGSPRRCAGGRASPSGAGNPPVSELTGRYAVPRISRILSVNWLAVNGFGR